MEPEWICGLPFYTVTNERMESMTAGEIVEELIQLKRIYNIRYPYDEAINNACNIIDTFPREKSVYDILKEK